MDRSYAGEIEYQVFLRRDGQRLVNQDGVADITQFIQGILLVEGITADCMSADVVLEDAAGLIGSITGTEQVEIRLRSSLVESRKYIFRCMGIFSRVKSSQGSEAYVLKCASEEVIANETINIFGHTQVLFKDTEGSNIIGTLLKDKRYLNSKKKFYSEKTLNSHSMISTNHRPIDFMNLLARRSIRKPKAGGMLQNGFIFFENSMGWQFKSMDKLVEDANKQEDNAGTNTITGQAQLYRYSLANPGIDEGRDAFNITGIGFEDDTNYLKPLRNGSYCGYSIGFDPVSLASSEIGLSEDTPISAYEYSLDNMWNNMEHLGKRNIVNPYSQIDKEVKEYINTPRRIRYVPIPSRLFDEKSGQAQATYSELSHLEAYEPARFRSMQNVKLNIEIPGNLDLYAGYAIDIHIPASYNTQNGAETDYRYSGRYLIETINHSITPTGMATKLVLIKDSTIRALNQISS